MESDSTGWLRYLAATSSGVHFPAHDWALVAALLVTLVVAATAAAAETALTSVSRIKIRNLAEEGDKSARRIARLLQQPQLFLSTILVVSNVSVITASTLATIIAVDMNFAGAEVVSTVVLSLIVLLFAEITPKSAAVQSPERWARALVGPVETAMFVLLPLVRFLNWLTSNIVRALGGTPSPHGPFVTEDELRLMVEVGEEEGVLEEEEREMIDNVFELADTSVREIMIPRIDMVTVEADASIEDATALILQGGQSRVPVFEDTIDNIIGVLYAKDLLRVYATNQRPPTVKHLVRPAVFVPESKRLDDLLRELQQKRVHIALAMDEYGQVAGLVTIEDLVEEIIGDIQDEYDIEEKLFEQVSPTEYIIDAKMPIDTFGEVTERELPEDGYDTVGGFVFTQLDKIPTIGDTVHFGDMQFTVLGTRGRRVTKIRVATEIPSAEVRIDDDGPSTGAVDDHAVEPPELASGEHPRALPPAH